LTRSTAPSPVFEGGVEKRRSGSTLSKTQSFGWEAEGLTLILAQDILWLDRKVFIDIRMNNGTAD